MNFPTLGLLAIVVAALLGAGTVGHAAESPNPPPDPFVEMVARTRGSVLAVGTYHFRDTPTASYFGTGFVVFDGNTLATNAHVVEAVRKADRLDALVVYVPDSRPGQGRRAVVVSEDPFHDVAILRFAGAPLPALPLAVEGKPRQGQSIAIVGYPIGVALGVVPAVHRGVIAAVVPAVRPLPGGVELTPELRRAIENPYNLYQLDLVVFPGNSGSPLLDARTGTVIGIINKTLASRTREHLLSHPSGIAYAVPVTWVQQLWQRVQAQLQHRKQPSDQQPSPPGPSAENAAAPAGE